MGSIILFGYLGSDPEDRAGKGEDRRAFCTFSIGNTKKWKNQSDNTTSEKTRWFQVKCSGKTAELALKNLKKGSRVLVVQGELDQDQWKDEKTGENRYAVVINAQKLQLLDFAEDTPATA